MQKITPNSRALEIIREQTNVVSKSNIVEQIYNETGVSVHRLTVYTYQKKLGLI